MKYVSAAEAVKLIESGDSIYIQGRARKTSSPDKVFIWTAALLKAKIRKTLHLDIMQTTVC